MRLRISALWSTMLFGAVMATPAYAGNDSTPARFITFQVPGADTTANDYNGTYPTGINDWGAIVGNYVTTNLVYRGFIRSPDGHLSTFQVPGADTTPGSYNGTIPSAINDLGEITGVYIDANGASHGFLRDAVGRFTTFDAPGSGGFTHPVGLNLEGTVVGTYIDTNSLFHAFQRRRDGTFSTWVGPGSCATDPSQGCYGSGAFSINIFGASAGSFEDSSANGVHHGLARSPRGNLTAFDAPGAGTGPGQGTGCPGCAPGINDWGAIAGILIDDNYVSHGYVRSPEGSITTFDAPDAGRGGGQGTGCSSDCPTVFNDAGLIAGTYIDANNVFHGYVRSSDGKVTSIDAPGAGTGSGQGTTCQYYCGLGVNQFGAVTGSYLDANNVFHGFLRLPRKFP